MDVFTPMFTAAFFMTPKRGNNPYVCRWTKKINKTWSIHTTEYYSALKRKEILTHATPWMGLEGFAK